MYSGVINKGDMDMTLMELEMAMHKLSVMRKSIATQESIYAGMPEGSGKIRRKAHIEGLKKELFEFLQTEV